MQDVRTEIRELTELLTRYQRAYYVEGRPLVTDSEFDRLFDRLLTLEAAHPELQRSDSPTARVGSDLDTSLEEVAHTIAVLSLDKAYTVDEVHQWITKSATRSGEAVAVVLEEKIDGVSIVLYYEDGLLVRALTRGDGYVGNDVTANVKTIASVPLAIDYPNPVAVRGEIYLPKSSFVSLNASLEVPYASPRNLAAGSIRRNKSKEVAQIPLDIFIYEGFWEGEE
ncbi:MAG TPA: DNA ligase (NAD(+)) LigA, partial [Sphaerochaeta sp.]|nr:DNA ligase (NAD(+)) LigA [Sphaerochaeta sp.]